MACSACSGSSSSSPVHGSSPGFGANWTVYHGDAEAAGVQAVPTTLLPARQAWTSPVLDGQLFGEPLVADGRVVAATENDTVYVLAARSGALPELVDDGGLVFPEGDIDAMKKLLRQALEDPSQFDDARRRGLARAHESLSVDRQADAFRAVFESL